MTKRRHSGHLEEPLSDIEKDITQSANARRLLMEGSVLANRQKAILAQEARSAGDAAAAAARARGAPRGA